MAQSGPLRRRAQPEHTEEIQPAESEDDAKDRSQLLGAAGDEAISPAAGLPPRRKRASLRAEAVALLVAMLVTGGVVLLAGWLRSAEPGTLLPSGERLFTPQQLQQFDGTGGRRIYLAILGSVYDVTTGAKHYGPKGGYRFFSGRDASRSYVTGKFKEDLNDDVGDLNDEQLGELVSWRGFYQDHKDYKPVGKVVGRFYDATGQPTALLAKVEAAAAAAAAAAAKEAAEGKGAVGGGQQGQPCNVKWSKSEGGSVWCDDGRFPRRVLQPDWQGQPQEQCMCMPDAAVDGERRLYDGCSPEAARCRTSPPEEGAGEAEQ